MRLAGTGWQVLARHLLAPASHLLALTFRQAPSNVHLLAPKHLPSDLEPELCLHHSCHYNCPTITFHYCRYLCTKVDSRWLRSANLATGCSLHSTLNYGRREGGEAISCRGAVPGEGAHVVQVSIQLQLPAAGPISALLLLPSLD